MNETADYRIGFVDPELGAAFDREGYVTFPLLDANEVTELRAEMIAHLGDNIHRANDFSEEIYTTSFEDTASCGDLHRKMSNAIGMKLSNVLSDFRVFESAAVTKPPLGRMTSFHVHPPMTRRPFARTMILWVPLSDVGPAQGGIRIVPRTQLLHRFIRTGRGCDYFESFRDQLGDEFSEPLTLQAGEALLFDNSLIHGSYPNASDWPRLTIVSAIFHPEHRHATYFDEGDSIAVAEGAFERVQSKTMAPGAPAPIPDNVVKRYPAWNQSLSKREFEALIALGQRATEDFDPLDVVRANLPPAPAAEPVAPSRRRLIPASVKRLVPASIRRRVPAALRARL